MNLQQLASEESLLYLGTVSLEYPTDYLRFLKWRSEGKHAGLAYLEKYDECRSEPRHLLEGARVAIILALPYFQGDLLPPAPDAGMRFAQYSRFADYHKLLRTKGNNIAERLLHEFPDHSSRVVVDSAPVLERALASKLERGFIGKNSLYIHPKYGSFLLLSEIVTTMPLPVDTQLPIPIDRKTKEGGCGPCSLCQTACPTGALDTAYSVDARKCLSYWTIEHRGLIPEEFWKWIPTYLFGCDLCQLACPYNGSAVGNRLPEAIPVRPFPSVYEIAVMDQGSYERYFGGTPATRAKRGGLRRNALIAMAVTRDPRLDEALALARIDNESPVGQTVEQIEQWRTQ